MRSVFFTFSGLLALLGNAALAEVPTSVVRYGDLDLSQPHDARVLHSRILWAAERVCAQYAGHNVIVVRQHEMCVRQAVENAIKRINRPELDAVHGVWTGKRSDPWRLAARDGL